MRSKLAGATFWASANYVTVEALVLVRNIVLARLIGPAEMGIALMLGLTLRLLEMLGDLSAERLVVQARDGDEPRFQATAQAVLFVRGIVSGVVLAALAVPAAHLFGYPGTAWAFASLAAVPVARGLVHLDYKRLQREMRFRATLIVELPAVSIATMAAVPLAFGLRNYAVIVWVNLIQAALMILASHAVAERRYTWRLDSELLRRFRDFGWPLLLNGVILFGVLQGDRLIVALSSSAAELGRFGIAFQLSMIPSLLLARIASSLMLPWMSTVQRSPALFAARYERGSTILACVGAVYLAAFMACGNTVIRLLFGSSFEVSRALVAYLAIAQAVRIGRTMPSIAAMARADSRLPLSANLFRLVGIAGAGVAAVWGAPLEVLAAAGCLGECLAGLAASIQVERRLGVSRSVTQRGLLTIGGVAGLSVGLLVPAVFPPAVHVLLSCGSALAVLLSMQCWRWPSLAAPIAAKELSCPEVR